MIREMTASEKVFCNKLRARGLKVDIYTSHETAQHIDHYDFVVNGQQVEFKEMKSVNRNRPKQQCDRQAVEHQAVHSPTGAQQAGMDTRHSEVDCVRGARRIFVGASR